MKTLDRGVETLGDYINLLYQNSINAFEGITFARKQQSIRYLHVIVCK